MTPSSPRLRILSVGGNAVSAFLSWRLGATNACDVTLMWKSGYEAVAQYGISFKSTKFGNERFKPRHVVRAPEEAAARESAFDYVIVCLKALPDVYDLPSIIAPVITPQHTCVVVNTTNALGVEKSIQERFPTNVVLSLVSGVEIKQIGSSEFEHDGSSVVWVGPTNQASSIPNTISTDMAEALGMTLSTGQVDCHVSPNIRQQQFEQTIGPIAFHPTSILFETPSHAELMTKTGVEELIIDVMEELCQVAMTFDCSFPSDFKQKTIESMTAPTDSQTIMYQDFLARKPMEVETYLGAPIAIAQEAGLKVPRLQTLYALLHHTNTINLTRPVPSTSPSIPQQAPTRVSSGPPPRPPMNGGGRGRIPSGPPGMGMPMHSGPPRRGPPPVNGFRGPPPPNGYPPRQMSRRPSFEDNNLDDFSHVVLYEELGEGDYAGGYGDVPNGQPGPDMTMRERELMLRQRELQIREQELAMRRGGGRRPQGRRREPDFDEDDEDDYFDPMEHRPRMPVDDNVDMLSVTSRRTKKAVSSSALRKDPNMSGNIRPTSFSRPFMGGRNRSSAAVMRDMPGLHDNLMDNPMMSYSSNRFATVDRKMMHDESRTNSLTAGRLQELGQQQGGGFGGNGGYPVPPSRRTSQSPGNPFSPMGRGNGRPSPPQDPYLQPNGAPYQNGGRPSPPGGVRAPVPRYPPGQGNSVQPSQVESQVGVSKPLPPNKGASKSLTGSASASAGSGESAHLDTEPSASSSQSSFAPRHALGVH